MQVWPKILGNYSNHRILYGYIEEADYFVGLILIGYRILLPSYQVS